MARDGIVLYRIQRRSQTRHFSSGDGVYGEHAYFGTGSCLFALHIQSPTNEAFKLLDGLHMDSVYTETRDGLDINNNEA